MQAILQTKQIKKHFEGVKAVDGLSISIEKGKLTCIIGPNGSGKTTLTNLLSGVYRFDAGSIVVDGVELHKMRPHDIAYHGVTRTFQNVRLFEQMTVLDNILVVLTERGVFKSLFERHKKHHLKQAEDVLKRVDLWGKRDELAANLSYGQRKLLEIGRALAMDAKIYLFDEPFAGLFKEMVKLVAGIIEGLRDEGKTVVLIEHNMDLIRQLSDHVIVMDQGKLLAQGRPEDVLSNREVINAYLGG